MSNVISLATRKPITTAPAKTRARRKAPPPPPAAPAASDGKPFSRTDDLEPHLLEPGHERDGAVYMALFLAQCHAKPPSHLPRNPLEALRKTRRALAILEIECAELALKQNGGAL
jgi:hypothetical protein